MKNITTGRLLIFLSISICSLSAPGQSIATYTVTFQGVWNDADHGPLPGNAHWSDLVGATHNGSVVFWQLGAMASAGIEDVAEVGVNTNFNNEVNSAISDGDADQWLQETFSPNVALGTCVIMSFDVSEDFPLLTLVSMIAPSPDWFIGLNSYSLLDAGNNWKDNINIDMYPYDAGTEEGSGYSTSNADTTPQESISSRTNITPFNDQKVGTITIELENILNLNNHSFDKGISFYPNPASKNLNVLNFSNEQLSFITIFDLLGKKIMKHCIFEHLREQTLNISELDPGLYLVRISGTSGSTLSRKLIVK